MHSDFVDMTDTYMKALHTETEHAVTAPNNEQFTETLSVKISDTTFLIVMDTGFRGLFQMSPAIHNHAYYEIQAVIDGRYSIEFSGGESGTERILQMENDMLCLIPPGCPHGTQAISELPQKLALRFFCEESEKNTAYEPLFASFQNALSYVTAPRVIHSSELCRQMFQIHKEMSQCSLGSDVMVRLYISRFYIELLRILDSCHDHSKESITVTEDSNHARCGKVEWYFGLHYNEQITESDLAAELRMSTRQTSRILRKIYGMSFREKLIDIRMTNAAKLLTTTDIPIEQIANQVGYASMTGFYLTFKKYFGVSGSEYRQQSRNKVPDTL